MSFQAFLAAIAVLGLLVELSLVVVLFVRRQYLAFPFFALYMVVGLLSDLFVALLVPNYSLGTVRAVGFALLPIQYVLEICVLLEICWHVLRPVQVSLPKGILKVFVATMVLALIGGALLAWHFDSLNNRVNDLKYPLDLTLGMLRMLIFALTASFAQMLGIGWKSKVLQLATALSFYSAVDLMVSVAERISGNFSSLEPLHGLAYCVELGFLVYAFTTKDVERREFSPQMEQFLVTLAGRARLARTVLVRMQVK